MHYVLNCVNLYSLLSIHIVFLFINNVCYSMDNIEYVNSMGFLNLTEEQLEEYPISALEGDSLKASFLFDYYSLHNDDYEEGIYFERK